MARRAGLAAATSGLLAGLTAVALGTALCVRAHLGLAPWDVLHSALARRTGLSFGSAVVATGGAVVVAAAALGVRPRPATALNVVVVGVMTDVFLADGHLARLAGADVGWRVLVLCGGLLVVAAGTQLYLAVGWGAGPRDGLMLGLAGRMGWRRGRARALVEGGALGCGFVLGGPAGLGTALAVILVWPAFTIAERMGGPGLRLSARRCARGTPGRGRA